MKQFLGQTVDKQTNVEKRRQWTREADRGADRPGGGSGHHVGETQGLWLLFLPWTNHGHPTLTPWMTLVTMIPTHNPREVPGLSPVPPGRLGGTPESTATIHAGQWQKTDSERSCRTGGGASAVDSKQRSRRERCLSPQTQQRREAESPSRAAAF